MSRLRRNGRVRRRSVCWDLGDGFLSESTGIEDGVRGAAVLSMYRGHMCKNLQRLSAPSCVTFTM